MIGYVDRPLNPLETHGMYDEGKMVNILDTIPINIPRPRMWWKMFSLGWHVL
jgi:hypothetical protein